MGINYSPGVQVQQWSNPPQNSFMDNLGYVVSGMLGAQEKKKEDLRTDYAKMFPVLAQMGMLEALGPTEKRKGLFGGEIPRPGAASFGGWDYRVTKQKEKMGDVLGDLINIQQLQNWERKNDPESQAAEYADSIVGAYLKEAALWGKLPNEKTITEMATRAADFFKRRFKKTEPGPAEPGPGAKTGNAAVDFLNKFRTMDAAQKMRAKKNAAIRKEAEDLGLNIDLL